MAVTKRSQSKQVPAKQTANGGLKTLLSAALALPGIAAEAAPGGYRSEDVLVNYHHAEYKEKGNRMKVVADHVSITAPVGRDYEVHAAVIEDVTTGASPVVNFLDIDGNPKQFVETGASIKDTRDIYEVSVGRYGDSNYATFKVGRSKEDDYESNYGSIGYTLDLNQKRTSLSFGASLSSDEVWNSYNPDVLLEEPSEFNRRKKKELMFGISQIINRNTTAQFNISYIRNEGTLTDPYKKAYVVDEGISDFRGLIDVAGIFEFVVDLGLVEASNQSGLTRLLNESPLIDVLELADVLLGLKSENRPELREQWVYLLRTSHYFESTNSGLHLDYRYSDDSWGADSHTFEAKWNIGFDNGWQLSPGLRYYSQSSTYFYDVFFESIPDDGYLSTDYRLAGFGALSKKLGLSKTFGGKYTFYVDYERYERRYSYEIDGTSNGSEIDDYRFSMLSLSVDAKF